MTSRQSRTTPSRAAVAPMHRGPQAMAPTASYGAPALHAPNAALLIDFDNVTMGIRSDLGNELRNLLSSDIIKGKVAVQRAYADWRRYPQYIVPLAESSIDMIMAPAYGSSKKNATDIRLSVDAMELVFTRPEIGTYILLSGDSDFASLVTKLKEYGKYVIGVGIRESSSDLLVMNCDEYYSYNSLAGLVKTSDEEAVKRDPWELVTEAVHRMKRNGDVMRADRLKQVMQDIDQTFDEGDLGYSKFSRFCQEAAQRGLLKLTKLENGQLEVDVAEGEMATATAEMPVPRRDGATTTGRQPPPAGREARTAERPREGAREDNGRRSRRGRGRGRDRERGTATTAEMPATFAPPLTPPVSAPDSAGALEPEMAGLRLTRDEAFNLVRRAVEALTTADEAVTAAVVRRKARELLGRDSESLSERHFTRILRDADDADLVDLRKHGDEYEVARAASAPAIADQLAPAAPPPAPSQAGRSAANAASLRRGMRFPRGGRGFRGELPPELLTVGVVQEAAAEPAAAAESREA
ncbi:MAG TPA: NYN domain-containing protein, partial [Gemmatimonadaceae bacterium]|nr:NYN domain-containing protein [Gemmatimonadaceae bacterium]